MPAFHREQIDAAVEAMEGGGGRRDRRAAARRDRRHLRVDAQPGDADRDAGAARPRSRRRRARAQAARALRAGAELLRHRVPPAAAARAGLAMAPDAALAGVLDEIVYAEIAERRRAPTPSAATSSACCSSARDEDGVGLSDEEIRDQVMTLMFAGHDTSTSTLLFLLYELARNPHALARLQAEQDEVLGGEPPTPAQLEKRAALPRHGPRRGPAPLPAGLDRAAARSPRLRVRRLRPSRPAPMSTTARGRATASPRSSPSPRSSSPSASSASARRRCRAAPTCPSAAARASASASGSARPRSSWWRRCCCSACASSCCPAGR